MNLNWRPIEMAFDMLDYVTSGTLQISQTFIAETPLKRPHKGKKYPHDFLSFHIPLLSFFSRTRLPFSGSSREAKILAIKQA